MRAKNWCGFVVCLFLLTGCKYDTLEEAIKKDIPFNVASVIHIEKVKDGAVVLYTTEQEQNFHIIETVAVAFVSGNDKNGWENIGNNHWEYEGNQDFSVYTNTFYKYDKKGKLEQKIPVVYGMVQSEAIETIQFQATGKNQKYEDIDIIKKNGKRYFIKLDSYQKSMGITKEGKKIIANLPY